MKAIALVALAAAFASVAADAGEAYKWTDANGVVHYSDVPPADKKADVTSIDTGPALSEADRKAAAARLASERAYLKKSGAAASALSVASSAAPSKASSSAPQTCDEQWKAYNESYACLNPYRVGGAYNGGQHVLPEGYAHCQVLPQPVHCPLPGNP